MPTIAGTWPQRLAWADALLGESRTTAAGRRWTPSTTIDDCALFQSALVYGDRAQTTWNVDGFKTAPHGTYHAGDQGLRPGDVLLFDWDHNGIGNHTECVVRVVSAGVVQTIGSNGSDSIAVAYRTRSTQYVLGYFRPEWPASATITPRPKPATPPAPTPLEDDMPTIITTKSGQALLVDGTITTFNDDADVKAALRAGLPTLPMSNEHLGRLRVELAKRNK